MYLMGIGLAYHIKIVDSHILEDTTATSHVLKRRRRGVTGSQLNLDNVTHLTKFTSNDWQ